MIPSAADLRDGSMYVLPLAIAAGAILLILWNKQRKEIATLLSGLHTARDQLGQREKERDLAQEELFRRLYEERELNKDKVQFQSQLAEYE